MDEHSNIFIGGWQIDASSCRIARDGAEKKLELRSMELLLYLARHPDQVVSRQEIEDNVWQDRVVGYDALSSSIAKIRKAFGDSSKQPRVIETIPKVGYRLIAKVLVEAIEPATFTSEAQSGQFERKLSAILYADVAEYSRLTGEDEDRTHRQLRINMKSISDEILRFQGRIVHYAGDAVLAEFATASTALHCALAAQQDIAQSNSHLPENQRVLFRIGVNLGEVIVDGEEIYGDGVNVAARLESLSVPGGVFISSTVFDAVGQKQNFVFEYQGEKTVKNIQRPVRAYSVALKSGASIPVPDAAPETATEPAAESAPAAVVAPERAKADLKFGPLLMFAIVVVAVGLTIGGFMLFYSTAPPAVTQTETPQQSYTPDAASLAILPFKNRSNDPGQGVFADGLTDDLITDLSRIKELQVIPRHSSFQFKDKKVTPQDVARQLNVRYLLQGSVRQNLDEIRVNVQLVDAQSNREVWVNRFDDKVDNIFALQDQIIADILKNLGVTKQAKQVTRRKTTNLEAYDYFLRAEHRRLNRRGARGSARIVEFYGIAIELDPQFIAAHTGLAREALSNWQLGDRDDEATISWKKMVYQNAGKALELDPANDEALAILGLLQALTGSHDIGIASVRNAVNINPANPQLHADLATVLSYAGNHAAALESINRAIGRHTTPPSAYFGDRARIYFFLGQYGKALADAEREKNVADLRNFTVFIHGALDNLEQAQAAIDLRLKARPWENRAAYSSIFDYYRRAQDIELILESAAKAGIP
ncbi:MAG: winged helix-turn-helix domain-containing protein [Gammaproteobacteria bacterium]|nr:winged helix-turn-helix domain-containing protein [Gammaproteobacteria bacterium]